MTKGKRLINMILGFVCMRFNNFAKKNKGYNLMEVIIYVAILGGLAVFTGNFLIHTVNVYQRARAERDVISNARLVLETLHKQVSQAQEVYWPTGNFNSDAGQLSLVTKIGAASPHSTSYVDFWLDNGRVWAKEEGSGAYPISAASVRVSKLRFERIVQAAERDAIKVTLQVDSASKFFTSITVNATTALRGNY